MILNCGVIAIVGVIQKFLINFFCLLKNQLFFFLPKLLNTIHF